MISLPGDQFIGRLLQHVLPPGLKRIRHHGLLAPATKSTRLGLARQLLAMPAPNPQACEDTWAFMRLVAGIDISQCPHCAAGRWVVTLTRLCDRQALACLLPPLARGPP